MRHSIQYIINDTGEKIAAIIPIRDYEAIMEALEEWEDIRAFDDAIMANQGVIPLNQALGEIEQIRSQQPERPGEYHV